MISARLPTSGPSSTYQNSHQSPVNTFFNIHSPTSREYKQLRGVRLVKNDFGSVLQKSCGIRFGFSFTKLTVVSVFQFG